MLASDPVRRTLIDPIVLPEKIWWFSIPGDPQPWKRKGGFGNQSFNPSKKAQVDIAWAVRGCHPTLKYGEESKHLNWGIRLAFFSPTLTTTDGDNLQKNFFDALNKQGIAWWDDKQIREASWIIVPDPRPRTEGVLYQISADYLASWSVLK